MRIILILLLIYTVYRTFKNYVLPELVRGMVADAEEQAARIMREKQTQAQNTNPTPNPKTKKVIEGEYVEYEEVK